MASKIYTDFLIKTRYFFEKEEKEFSSFEEFEKYYTKERLFQNLIWDKALLTVAQNAHRLETN